MLIAIRPWRMRSSRAHCVLELAERIGGRGGAPPPPQLCQYSHSQSLQPFTEGGKSTTPLPSCIHREGGGSTTPPQLPKTGRGRSTTPPVADKQIGVGPPPLPRSFQRSEGKAPPPLTPHLAANLFLGFGVTRSNSSVFFLFLCLLSSMLYCA